MNRTLTPGYLTTLHRGLNLTFNKALSNEGKTPPLFQKLCMATKSTGAEEEYDWMGDMPILTEIKGEQTKKNLQSRQVVVTNKEFSVLIGLKRATLERDKAGLYTPRIKGIGASARKWGDNRLKTVMVTNGTSASYPDWTGKAYFAADKPMGKDKKAPTFTNLGSSALTAASYEAAVQNLRERLDANGEPMNLGAEGFVLVCGPKLESTAKKILKAETVVESGAGVTNVNANTAELVVWGHLIGAADDYWYLFANDSARAPFINQEEVPPATYMCTNPNDSHVMTYNEYLFQVYMRGELGPGESLLSFASVL